MLICRGCGQSVRYDGFCSNCMTSVHVREVKDEDELDLPKTMSSSSNEPPSPTIHGKNEGIHIAYSFKKPTVEDKHFTCCCGSKFITKDMFELHTKSHKHYNCYYCGEKHDTYNGLRLHLIKCTKFLMRNKKFKCHFCDEKFETSEDLQLHVKATHKKYKCRVCEKSFNSDVDLKQHMDIHEKYRCKVCKRWFKTKKKLDKHIKAKHS